MPNNSTDTEKMLKTIRKKNNSLVLEYDKAVYGHLVYLTSMQCTSCEMLGWMTHKLESRLLGEVSPPQICR